MTCKDCIHNGVCFLQEVTNDIDKQLKEFGCEDFKNKADFVEVERCKDCRRFAEFETDPGVGYCKQHKSGVLENDFCSYGERK